MYTLAIVVHVVVAVLGAGQAGALALAVSSARRAGAPPSQVAAWAGSLLRTIRWSLALLVVTGLWLDYLAAGGWHHKWWLRISFLLIALAFFFQRRAMGALAATARGEGDAVEALGRMGRAAWWM